MKKNIYPNLKNVRIGIVSHVFASGPSQALLEYLIEENRAAEVFFIGHPLFFEQKKERSSFFILYKKGKKINEKFLKNIKLPGIITYFKDFFLTIVWVLQTSGKWDLLVCADNLNSLSGLILRFFKKVKKVIFYTVDYVPQRFENKLLNNFYHLIDKICVYYVDEVWNLSPEMEKARKKFRGIVTGKNKQRVIPMGIWFDKIKKIPFEKIKKHTLVFVGHLIEKQGIQTVIQAIPGVVSKIPDFRFLIVGTGPYEKTLKKITKDLGLEKRVEFTGYIESHHEMENIINKCVCAIAFYKGGDRLRNFTYYSDPGKIKDYLGAGLPVILTNVPYNARELEKRKCGIIVDYRKENIAKAIVEFMGDEGKLRIYHENAIQYAKEFNWNKIFGRALERII